MITRPLKVGYLVIGLIYIGLAGTWLLNETDVINPDGFQWLVPTILLGAGLIGLFASLGKGLMSKRVAPEVPPPVEYDTAIYEDTTNGEPQ